MPCWIIELNNNGLLETVILTRSVPPSAGSEAEGSGFVGHVSFPDEEQGVDVDPNQQLHLPEPVL